MSGGSWSGGLAEWQDGGTTYLSVAFTWRLDEAYSRALFAKACGQHVVAGGPALFLVKLRHLLVDVAEVPTKRAIINDKEVLLPADHPGGEVAPYHNSDATIASRGCPVGCAFCIVPVLEGRAFTLLPDFSVRPILCDNNLSALPGDYQDHIIARYRGAGVQLRDANSGFEPKTFDDEVYRRWAPLLNEGRGPWRFAYDELKERADVRRVMRMLKGEPSRRKRVYVLIGNEPMAECLQRIQEVIEHGCEPHVQPYMKLNTLVKRPHVRFDWTEQSLRAVARWANRHLYKYTDFHSYRVSTKTRPVDAAQLSLGEMVAA